MCLSSDCDGVELSGRILVSHISLLLDPGTVPSKYVSIFLCLFGSVYDLVSMHLFSLGVK